MTPCLSVEGWCTNIAVSFENGDDLSYEALL